MMMTEYKFGSNYDIFLKTLYDIVSNKTSGLQEPNNDSFSRYNNGRKDKLFMNKQNLYLTLDDDVYSICKDNGEIIESRQIAQNENGIDIEDRVLVGLQLLNKYMDLFDEDSWTEIVNRLEWK